MDKLTQEIRDFVNKQKLGFIATVCPDGTPNLSPKGTTIAWDDEHMAFADIHSPGTVDNLIVNPAIEINVVDVFSRKGYRFKGKANVFSEGPIFREVVSYYRAAGSNHPIIHIVLVKVDQIRRLVSPVYTSGVTEDEVRKRWIDYWNSVNKYK